ncbi:MAG TPA: carboxy terminal-processing peptidase [Chitinophagaceae bacterium]|nr:carboxy terminal-processing peptidase [Chitinophagaceae bacterium]
MAEKFHFQPKPLNDEFSSKVFLQVFKQLDEDKIFFTSEDIKTLSAFQFSLDDEIKNKKASFLTLLTKIYSDRLSKADTMITVICKTAFNFSLPEKITVAESESYPADEKAMRGKLYKFIKAAVIDEMLEEEDVYTLSSLQLKKYVDSIEPVTRRRVQKAYKHPINIMLQTVGGIQQAVGEEYCKAIAVTYDPHTAYFPPTEKENFESHLGQKSMIFGFTVKEEDDGSVKIENLAPGSPAFKSGQLNKGDKIESIQWNDQKPIDVANAGAKEVSDVLKMSNHEKATFKIKKADGTERSVSLWKEQDEDAEDGNRVKSFLLKGSRTIGFLSLPAFYEDWEDEKGINGCANDVAKEILKLKKENIEGLILDLRYNGGGSMQEAVELAGIFIDAGPVGQFKTKEAKIYTLKDVNRGTIYDGPLMILVNGYSASASEMVAGTLQDYNRAVIVGSPTYGKATAQVVLPMDTTIDMKTGDFTRQQAASYLKTTVSQLFRATGNTAQAKGVLPDIELPDMLQAHPRREADEVNALISTPIESSKYFKPYAAVNFSDLKAAAKIKTDASPYFSWLRKYIESEKQSLQKKDINLKLIDVISEQNKIVQSTPDSNAIKHVKIAYTVQNNSFEKQQMLVDNRLKELNRQWAEFLHEDPCLHVAYDVMLLMIK